MKNGLQKILISNYQSIRKADIKLGNITIISGRSDSGKSALFRAIKGAVINQSGDEYITVGEKETTVQIDNVKWIQSRKENAYEIDNKRWEKCGRGVPEEVRSELNIGEFEFGKDIKLLLNFSGQLEGAFVVQGNPADNAKVIGSISNVHVVYNGIREAEKDTKNIKRKMNSMQEQLEETKIQLESEVKSFERIDKYYRVLEEVFTKAHIIDNAIVRLLSLRKGCIVLTKEKNALERKLEAYKDVKFGKIAKNIELSMKLTSVGNKYSCLKPDITGLNSRLKAYNGVKWDKIVKLIDSIGYTEGLMNRYKSLQGDIGNAEKVKNSFGRVSIERGLISLNAMETLLKLRSKNDRINQDIRINKDDIKSRRKELKELSDELKEIDVCEVCGSEKEYWNIGV